MRHHIIYIPGLGDGYNQFRRASLRLWRLFGVSTQLIPIRWYEESDFDMVRKRVEAAIEAAQAKGLIVSLVGESAGASVAIDVAAGNRAIYRLVTICGVVNPSMKVSESILGRSPVFRESLRRLATSLAAIDERRTHVVYALNDSTVAKRFSTIPGAHHHRLFTVGHRVTVILCLTILSKYIISLVRY